MKQLIGIMVNCIKENEVMKNDCIKKYPIFYQGEEYEIRIEKFYNYTEYINIYKVIKYKNWVGKEKISYDLLDSTRLDLFNSYYKYKINSNSETYYVDLFKEAFNSYLRAKNAEIKKDEKKAKQLAALENWDGVIS